MSWKDAAEKAANKLNDFIVALEEILKEAAQQAGDAGPDRERFRIILGTALGNAAMTVDRFEKEFKSHPALVSDMHNVVLKLDQRLACLKLEDIDRFIPDALAITRNFKQYVEGVTVKEVRDGVIELTNGFKNFNELVAWYKQNKRIFIFGGASAFIIVILTLAAIYIKLLMILTR